MSSLIFVSPLAVSAMVSLWLGFKMRLIMFGAWVSICLAIALFLMKYSFGDETFVGPGMTLLGSLAIFEFTAFGLGLLVGRARSHRNAK